MYTDTLCFNRCNRSIYVTSARLRIQYKITDMTLGSSQDTNINYNLLKFKHNLLHQMSKRKGNSMKSSVQKISVLSSNGTLRLQKHISNEILFHWLGYLLVSMDIKQIYCHERNAQDLLLIEYQLGQNGRSFHHKYSNMYFQLSVFLDNVCGKFYHPACDS